MIVKTLEIELYLAHSNSLKDKRRILKSIIDRLRQRFNVSIAEIDDLDDFRYATLGIVTISNNQSYVDTILDKSLNYIESNYEIEIIKVLKELR